MSNEIITSDRFHDLFVRNVPFIDVRAKSEFDKGHLPTSFNLPILNDEERHAVGACFKNNGQEAAIKLGHTLVNGDIKEKRIDAWCDFAKSHENSYLYCWRGGMRSEYASLWMNENGMKIPRIEGGFKALRNHLINQIENTATHIPMILIGGKTGTSKTILVNSIKFSTDLEGHANHRGSSFGRRISGIQTQIDFENALGIDLIKKRELYPNRKLVLEDESRRIGNCIIPDNFINAMHSSPIGIIEMPMDLRINHIVKEYVIEMYQEHMIAYPENGWEIFVDYLTQSLARVQKKLGPDRYIKIHNLMQKALQETNINSTTNLHDHWVQELLSGYYDPMYEYQLSRKSDLITFRGSYDEVMEWAKDKSISTN
jgi:tRNA 2-selenouridine synthase